MPDNKIEILKEITPLKKVEFNSTVWYEQSLEYKRIDSGDIERRIFYFGTKQEAEKFEVGNVIEFPNLKLRPC